jgi:hypothetical protein
MHIKIINEQTVFKMSKREEPHNEESIMVVSEKCIISKATSQIHTIFMNYVCCETLQDYKPHNFDLESTKKCMSTHFIDFNNKLSTYNWSFLENKYTIWYLGLLELLQKKKQAPRELQWWDRIEPSWWIVGG